MKLSKEKVLQIRKSIDEAVQAVAEREGCTIDTGTVSYSPQGNFNVTLKGGLLDEVGVARTREANDYESYGAHLCKLDHVPLGAVLKPEGHKVVGYASRKRSKCIVLESPDGRTLFATPEYIRKRYSAAGA